MVDRESRGVVVPAPLLVLGGVLAVQFGGALAATLVPEVGAGGSVLLRIGFAAVLLYAVARPRLRGHTRRAWATVVAFGVALGLMNWRLLRLAGAPAAGRRGDRGVPRAARPHHRALAPAARLRGRRRGGCRGAADLRGVHRPVRRPEPDRARPGPDRGRLLGGVHPVRAAAPAPPSRASTGSRWPWSWPPSWCCPSA